MQLSETLAKFDDELVAMSPNTQRTYRRAAKWVVDWIGPKELVAALTPQTFIDLVKDLVKREYAPSTASIYITVIKQYLDMLVREEWLVITNAQMLKIQHALHQYRPGDNRKKPMIPTERQVQAVMDMAYSPEYVALRPTPLYQRNQALVEVLAATGMRIQEVADLKVSQIDLDERVAMITGKGRKQRKVFFSEKAVATLRAYWRVRPSGGKTAPAFAQHGDAAGDTLLRPIGTAGLRNVISELAKLAGVSGFTPHKFRHYFASKLQRLTGDVVTVQEALGHANIETTRVYVHVNADTVQAAVQQLHHS
jgi:integrase/recombinase XerC